MTNKRGNTLLLLLCFMESFMENRGLKFYLVDPTYVDYLKKAEIEKRGFSRVPNVDYGPERKQKFLCGIVLTVNSIDYYVSVTSQKEQKPDNFLIYAKNGKAVGSLRFNYMFPVPDYLVTERNFSNEKDKAYKSLLEQELDFCIKHQEEIRFLAERTHKKVLQGNNPGLTHNSCDFALLEEKYREYVREDRQRSSQAFVRKQNAQPNSSQNHHKSPSSTSRSLQRNKPQHQTRCKVTFNNRANGNMVDVYLNIVPQNYIKGRKDFLLTPDERFLAIQKLNSRLKDEHHLSYDIVSAEMVGPIQRYKPKSKTRNISLRDKKEL